jgi:hypothetical protein
MVSTETQIMHVDWQLIEGQDEVSSPPAGVHCSFDGPQDLRRSLDLIENDGARRQQ